VAWDTKIVVVVREDLPVWQKLNVTAFAVSGIAATVDDVTGENYRDATGNVYLPMFRQPVLVFTGDQEQLKKAHERGLTRAVPMAVYTDELFATYNDEDNRAAVSSVEAAKLNLAGLALRADARTADKIVKGLSLHP
jgi:hypothetical protein